MYKYLFTKGQNALHLKKKLYLNKNIYSFDKYIIPPCSEMVHHPTLLQWHW